MKVTIYKVFDKVDHFEVMNTVTGEVFVDLYDRLVRIASYVNGFNPKQLRSCKATVYSVDGNKLLRSYNTLIALYKDGIVYDMLRTEYGYTNTSAQHIRKFAEDCNATEIIRFIWG